MSCCTRYKPLVEVCGVHDGKNAGRPLHVRDSAEHDVRGDSFFERVCAESKHAGQIDELKRTITNSGYADMFFDGDARVIAGLLPHAGQAIEKRTFAGVRITDDRDTCRRVSAQGNLVSR